MTTATKATEYPSATAKARFVRVSPRKARRVVDLVRGRSVADALDILRWAPQAASEPVAKVAGLPGLATPVMTVPLG